MNSLFGQHLLIDGYVEDESVLMPGPIQFMFDNLVETLGMQYLQRPLGFKVDVDASKLLIEWGFKLEYPDLEAGLAQIGRNRLDRP